MKSVVFALLITLLHLRFTFAQEWQSIGPPGGRVTALAINPQQPNIVFGSTSDNVLFKTEDAGFTSNVIFDTIGFLYSGASIVFNPVNPNIIYAGSNRSTDGGTTWKRLNGIGSSLAINPKNSDRIFTSSYGKQVFVSNDGGISWSFLYQFDYIETIVISPSDTNVLFAVTADSTAYAISKSTDGGNTWQETSLKVILPNHISSIAVNPLNSNVVYVSTSDDGIFKTSDGGITWNIILSTVAANDIAIGPNDTSTVYAVTGDYLQPAVGNVFKTTNGGISWSIINNGLPSDYNRYIYHVEINPQNSEEVYIGTYGFGVYRTTNGGTNWLWTNLTKAAVISMSFHPSQSGYMYAGTYDEGIVQTTNGGETWSRLPLNASTTVQTFFRQLQFNPQNINVAYLTAGPYGLLKSTNGGSTWQQTTLGGSFDTWAWSIAIHPTNPETLYVGQTGWLGRDLYRSTNGGLTWENLQVTNSTESIEQIKFNPLNASIIYVCAPEIGFFRTTNDGNTWSLLNSGLKKADPPLVLPVRGISIDQGNNILYLAQGGGGVFKSTDDGNNWFAIDSTLSLLLPVLNVQDVCISPTHSMIIYASLDNGGQKYTPSYSPGGVFVTTNDGASWQRIFNGPSQEIEFDPHNSNQLYVATKAGVFSAKESDILSVKTTKENYPNEIFLYNNYPNPFNSQTTIRYAIKRSGSVTIRLFNILGKEVRKYRTEVSQPGEYKIQWDGRNQTGEDVSSGVYFYRLETPFFTATKKLLLLR